TRGEPFRLVLLDAVMPGLDGFQVAEQIKRRPELAGAVIMMLSSADRQGDAARCRELGIARHLTKPVKQSDLLDAILPTLSAAWASASTPAPAGARGEQPLTVSPLRILVVEDNATNQMLVVRILEKQGHQISVAGNGCQALEKLGITDWHSQKPSSTDQSGSGPPFDLVLMDVQMPEMDGFEATGIIPPHERDTRRHLPIVAMTAHAMKGDQEQCLAAGMDAYLSKPIQRAELQRVIASATRKKDELELAPAAEPDTASAENVYPKAKAVDRAVALKVVGGDTQVLQSVVETFLGECGKLVSAVRTAVEARDAPALRRA